MQKEKINELLKYTRSKRILRAVFLYNSEELLDNINKLYIKLNNSNRSDIEKNDLIMAYIRNRKKDHIEYLICNSQIINNYTFKEQKELIKQYVSSHMSYEQIVNESYKIIMNNEDKKSNNTINNGVKKYKNILFKKRK